MIEKIESLENFETDGLFSPLTFGSGVRHAASDVLILRSNAADRSFSIVSDRIPVE